MEFMIEELLIVVNFVDLGPSSFNDRARQM